MKRKWSLESSPYHQPHINGFFNVINEQKAKWKLQMAKRLAVPESLNFYVKFLTSELSMVKEVNWVRLNMLLL